MRAFLIRSVQPAERIPTRLGLGGVPPTGHPAYPGLPVRCRSGSSRSSRGLAPVLRLGWVGAAHPFIGQDRRVRFSNFAEVGLGTPHLSLETPANRYHAARCYVRIRGSTSESGFKARKIIIILYKGSELA